MSVPAKVRGLVGRVDRRTQPVKYALLKVPAIRLVVRTAREMSHDDATHMAAGVAYYAILSFFPLTIGLMFVFSLVLESDTVETELFEFFQTYLPGTADILGDNVQSVENIRGILGVLGVLGLFWTASALFGAISRAVDRAWDVHEDRPFYIAKLRHIAMSMAVGLLFLLSLGATGSLQVLSNLESGGVGMFEHDYIKLVTRVLPFVFTLAIFLVIYKYVPNTKTHWRYIWPGALLAAIIFEVCKNLFVFYLDNFANYAKVYGSLGAVIAFLGWTYISSFILILGAEFSSEYERMREGVGQGRLVAGQSRRRTRQRRH